MEVVRNSSKRQREYISLPFSMEDVAHNVIVSLVTRHYHYVSPFLFCAGTHSTFLQLFVSVCITQCQATSCNFSLLSEHPSLPPPKSGLLFPIQLQFLIYSKPGKLVIQLFMIYGPNKAQNGSWQGLYSSFCILQMFYTLLGILLSPRVFRMMEIEPGVTLRWLKMLLSCNVSEGILYKHL